MFMTIDYKSSEYVISFTHVPILNDRKIHFE